MRISDWSSDVCSSDLAVWAVPDEDAKNKGGWRAIVAIADVSFYVRPDGALDREARRRGNSVYFPDRVVPMLPETLSAGVCSLKAGEDRAAMACHLTIDRTGKRSEERRAGKECVSTCRSRGRPNCIKKK